jgi:hypothetical protein
MPRGCHSPTFTIKAPHPPRIFPHPQLLPTSHYLIRMQLSATQEYRIYHNNGMLDTIASHPSLPPLRYAQSPPSLPVRSRSPAPRAGAHQSRSSTLQLYVFSYETYE